MSKNIAIFSLLIVALTGCITNPVIEESLDGVAVNKIEVLNGQVFFCTDDGIYKKAEGGFLEFGLQGERILDITRIGNDTYLSAKAIENDVFAGEVTLFKRLKGKWYPFTKNFGGEDGKYTWVTQLLSTEANPSVVFATGGTNVVKSENGGKNWVLSRFTWDAVGRTWFLEHQPGTENTIWSGGEVAIPFPYLVRSTNGGDTWEHLKTIENTGGINFDIVFNPKDTTQLIITLGGLIRKSYNGGDEWQTVLDSNYFIYTLTNSAIDSLIVYGSGINESRELTVIKSENFGESWSELPISSTLGQVFVNDMVAVVREGVQYLYIGTNKGLFVHQL